MTGLEFDVLTGVILRRLERRGDRQQRRNVRAVRQTDHHSGGLCVLLQTDGHHRPAVDFRQPLVHIAGVFHVLRGPQPLRNHKAARPEPQIQYLRGDIFLPNDRAATEDIFHTLRVRYHRRHALRNGAELAAGRRVARITNEEVAVKFALFRREHRSRIAHPGIHGKTDFTVALPYYIAHRTTGFPAEIDKPAPALFAFNQRKAAVHRFAFQARHTELPALSFLAIGHVLVHAERLRQNLIAVVIGRTLWLIEIEAGG